MEPSPQSPQIRGTIKAPRAVVERIVRLSAERKTSAGETVTDLLCFYEARRTTEDKASLTRLSSATQKLEAIQSQLSAAVTELCLCIVGLCARKDDGAEEFLKQLKLQTTGKNE